MGGRCVGHGGARAPPPFCLKIGKIYRLAPPPILVMIIVSNSGGSIKNYQVQCTVCTCTLSIHQTLLYTYIM